MARTAQASFVTLGNVWRNHCVPRPPQSRGQARGCGHVKHCFSRRTILRRSSCRSLEHGIEPIWSQLEKKGVTVNPARVQQSGAEPLKRLCQHYSGEGIRSPGLCAGSAVGRGLRKEFLLAPTLEHVRTAPEPAVLVGEENWLSGSYSPSFLVE